MTTKTQNERKLQEIIKTAENFYYDVRLSSVAKWKKEDPKRKAVACLPIYTPFELLLGSGVKPVMTWGGGDQVNIIRGDSYYQSYICHFPRSVVELGLTSWKDAIDGLICPAICDVIRNVSGVWQVLFPDKLIHYLDFPQNFDFEIGGSFYRQELESLAERLRDLSGTRFDPEQYRKAIILYNKNRKIVRKLSTLRVEKPHLVPAWEYYLIMRAGGIMDVSEHTKLLEEYHDVVLELMRPEQDSARIMIIGAFCEQPPLNLIKTIERSGCDIIDDDFTLGFKFIEQDLPETGDPFEALVNAYLIHSTYSSVKYEGDEPKSEQLVRTVRAKKADGVLLMSPSFCDPSLLDRPHFQRALDEEGIPYTALQYAENLGQFQAIQEQTGTFAEAIKLWGESAH